MSDPVFYTGGYVDGDDSRRRVPTVHVGVDGGPAKGWCVIRVILNAESG